MKLLNFIPLEIILSLLQKSPFLKYPTTNKPLDGCHETLHNIEYVFANHEDPTVYYLPKLIFATVIKKFFMI